MMYSKKLTRGGRSDRPIFWRWEKWSACVLGEASKIGFFVVDLFERPHSSLGANYAYVHDFFNFFRYVSFKIPSKIINQDFNLLSPQPADDMIIS
jgi:hypothetical protein